jgi:hypothetical protein
MTGEYLTYTISNNNLSTTGNTNFYTTTSSYCNSCYTWYWGYHSCCHHDCCNKFKEVIVYKYQIVCPKCETKMWGEVDEKVKCPSCKKTILVKQAEKKDYDLEVEV